MGADCNASVLIPRRTTDVIATVPDTRGNEMRGWSERDVPDGVATERAGDDLVLLDFVKVSCCNWHPLGLGVHTFDPNHDDPLGFISWTDKHPMATPHVEPEPESDETLKSKARTSEAIAARLDTRCIKWPMNFPAHTTPQRCGDCDGCVASRWVEAGQVSTGRSAERALTDAEVEVAEAAYIKRTTLSNNPDKVSTMLQLRGVRDALEAVARAREENE